MSGAVIIFLLSAILCLFPSNPKQIDRDITAYIVGLLFYIFLVNK